METLNLNGLKLPKLGLGTWRLSGSTGQKAIESALALGYRHIDTAEMYGNEEIIGAAITASGLPRSQLTVTTKVWHDHLTPDAMRRAMETSLKKLRLDQTDLYLIHWPARNMTMKVVMACLQTLQSEGWTRGIGVANFTLPLLRIACENLATPLACNQVEYHVYLDQSPLLTYMRKHGIVLTAYCPLAQGEVNDDPTLRDIARKHLTTPSQVALAWLLEQPGVAAIPKASRPESQQANLDALKLKLDNEDLARISALPKDRRLVNPSFAPLWDQPPQQRSA